jgi:type I restriction enzyme S subunit
MSQLPSGWVKSKIDDVCFKPEQKKPEDTDVFTYIDIASVDRNKKKISGASEILGKDAPSRARKIVNTNDILVSMTRPNLNAVAKVEDIHDGQIASTGFDVLKPVLIKSDWIFSIVKSKTFINQMSGTTIGALYPACKASDIRGFEIPLPPLAEQSRIVEKLDEVLAQVDTIKARLDGIPAILKRFRQSVLASAVSGKLTEEWRSGKSFDIDLEISEIQKSRQTSFDLDAERHLARTGKKLRGYDYSTLDVEPSIRHIPEEWKLIQLGNIVSYLTDYHANGSYKVLKEHVELKDVEDFACMIRSTNFEKNNFEDLFVYITENAYDFLGKSKLYGGEILVSKIGNAGSVYHMPVLNRPASLAMNLFALRFDENKLSSTYLHFFLTSTEGEKNIQQYVRGVATKSIDKKSLRSVYINFPSFTEQKEIVRLVDQYFGFADTIEAQVKKAQSRVDNLTQSILAKAFRGELVPQDPNDESADKLLERIAQARKDADVLAKAAKKVATVKKKAAKK